jgi:hypothetical protein
MASLTYAFGEKALPVFYYYVVAVGYYRIPTLGTLGNEYFCYSLLSSSKMWTRSCPCVRSVLRSEKCPAISPTTALFEG